jgi:hypothetical protein
MSLYFPYKLISLGHAIVPLGGRWVRPRPILSVSLLGPLGVFPEEFAAIPGIDLRNAPEGFARDLGKGRVRLQYARVGCGSPMVANFGNGLLGLVSHPA